MKNNEKINLAVLGASGYTGAELIRLLHNHPHVSIQALSAERHAGKMLEDVFPHLRPCLNENIRKLFKISDIQWKNIDLVFCALPHGTTQDVVKNLPNHIRVIDISADFRLSDPDTYSHWYNREHSAVNLQSDAVYALPEHIDSNILKEKRILSCPGCYPTSILLPILPLLKEDIIDEGHIIADSKSGVSGAGRSLKEGNLHSELSEGFMAYGIGSHRHMAEIEQEINLNAKRSFSFSFTPHLLPMNRGILSTIYFSSSRNINEIRNVFDSYYKESIFVHLLGKGEMPMTKHVRGSNYCFFNVFNDRQEGRYIITSVIDNLVKGASGQAIQVMNKAYGFNEDTGLTNIGIFP